MVKQIDGRSLSREYYSSLLTQVVSRYRETINYIDATNVCVSSETLFQILFQCPKLKTFKLDIVSIYNCDIPEGGSIPIEHLEFSYSLCSYFDLKDNILKWLPLFTNLQTV